MSRALLAASLLPALLALSVGAAPAVGAQSPSESVLVSNVGQTDGHRVSAIGWNFAHAFSTGGNAAGYSVSSVDVQFFSIPDADAASRWSVTIQADAGGSPGAVVGTLTWPAFSPFTDTDTALRFTAPGAGIHLAASTTYFLVITDVTGSSNSGLTIRNTPSDSEDAGAAPGWSIADSRLQRVRTSTAAWSTSSQTAKIRINGAAAESLVSAPSVVFVGEGETVSVRLDLNPGLDQGVTGTVPVTATSSDPSRVRVNHPDQLFMGRTHLGHAAEGSFGVEGVLVQTNIIPGSGRRVRDNFGSNSFWSDSVRLQPSGSISFDFTAADWAGWRSYDEPSPHKGYRVVEVTGVPTGADGRPANGPDAIFQLSLSSSDASVAFAPITVVVKRSRGLDPVFDPDPRFSFGCRERECLRVGEGGTVQYTVRNSNVPAPGSPLTITPTGEGLSFDPAVVSWTHRDHDEPRTVTVTAVEDDDMRSDTRIVRHVFSENWDTSGSLSKLLRRTESKAEAESAFNMAVRVVDDDVSGFATVNALGNGTGQVKIISRPGFVGSSGVGRFWVTVDGPPDCTGRTPGLCRDVLYIRLRTPIGGGFYDNASVAATVYRADTPPAPGGSVAALPYSKLAGPRNWFAIHVTPDNWNKPFRVNLSLDPSLVNGSSGDYDISMSLAHANGEPTRHATLRASWGPFLSLIPDVGDDSYPVDDGDPVGDGQQAPAQDQDTEQDQAVPDADSGGADPVRYGADPGVVAAVVAEVKAHIADFAGRSHANGVRDWTLVLDRLEGRGGMSDADIAVWLARSVKHGWQDGVTTLPKVQAVLAAPQPVVVPQVSVTGSVGGSEGSGVSFTVTAVPVPAVDLAVGVTVAASGDFGVPTGARTVTVPAGQSSATLTLPTVDDSVDEPDGSVTLTVNSDANGGYTVGSVSSGSVQVLDDDDPPQVAAPVVSISAGPGVSEGGAATFTVSVDAAPAADLPVSVSVSASGDFGVVTGSRTVTIAAGTTSKALSVATVGDTADEADGSVSVTVADGADYDVGTATATVAVADDDEPPPPVVSVTAGAGVTEGGAASFTLTASPPPVSAITVSVSVGASGDFGAATGSRTVPIPTGGSATFTVATSDDSVDEADGSVSVTVADGADYDVGTATATVAVADDDDPPPPVDDVPETDDIADTDPVPDTDQVPACTGKPTVSAADATAQRGDDLEFVISIDCAHTSDVDVHYSVTHDGSLYIEGAGIATIASGDTTTTVTMPTTGSVAEVGIYLAYVTGVTNPWGVWAHGTITD